MCGIFGIVTERDCELGPILMEAGQRLSYRGYDSVGCATVSAGGIDLRKDVGKIEEVNARLHFDNMRGQRGILQLRWATFGEPVPENAQPHLDCDGDLAGAHNGNITNNLQLRELLMRKGHTFRGENDGETCVHLVEHYFDQCHDMVEAIRQAYKDLSGDYALIITQREDNRLYAIKKGMGLVIGLGNEFTCCSSDLPSILPLTRRILRMQDGEIAILTPQRAELRRVSDGSLVERDPEFYQGDIEATEKGNYSHFMLKEIHEEPSVARKLLRFLEESAEVTHFLEGIREGNPVFFIGCGCSYNASLLGAYYFNLIASKLVIPLSPMQFIEQCSHSVDAQATAVFVSQSGETKDILNATQLARRKGMRSLGVLNVQGSTLATLTDRYLPLACGYEISVPATKTFLNEAILFLYLAHRLAGADTSPLTHLPELLEQTLEQTGPQAERLAERLAQWDDLYYLGYGITHPIAQEGALTLKKIAYSHCEGIFSSEFKHGPLSAVRQGYPVVFITAPDDVEMMINHISEVTCRKGFAVAIAEECERLRKNVHEYISVPASGQLFNPLLATVVVQLVAYHTSIKRGLDPDFPRNLSKTLTVD